MDKKLPKILVIVGPTASGKTDLAIFLAKKFGGEVVSADSRLIYRGLNIGAAKPVLDANMCVQGVKHHLIDVADPDKELSLAEYKILAEKSIDGILARGKLPIIVGGTGLYIWAVVDNLSVPEVPPNKDLRKELDKLSVPELVERLRIADPDALAEVDAKNPRRLIRALEVANAGKTFHSMRQRGALKYEALQLGIAVEREELKQRIKKRLEEQLKDGLEKEVRGLADKFAWNLPGMSGIGYREWKNYFAGETTLEMVRENVIKDTNSYAKRQMTWFRKDKRIKWIADREEAEREIKKFIK